MNSDFSFLVDPQNRRTLFFKDGNLINDEGKIYHVLNSIPRFVSEENYASDFGIQWNLFARTQLDSYTGSPVSERRLARCLRGELVNLQNRLVLEAGSGAGRFTELLLKYGAVVHSFDYSTAVDANASNNSHHRNLTLVQADIAHLPFPKESYDCVVCLGVIQHTPSPEQSIIALWNMVRPGGILVFDHYRWNLGLVLPPPLGGAEKFYRWFILRLPQCRRFSVVKWIVNFWFSIHWFFRESLIAQRVLVRLSPVHFYYPDIELKDREMYLEWALLDTHDGTTDFYKHYRKEPQILEVLGSLGAQDIDVRVGGNGIEAFCRKPGI